MRTSAWRYMNTASSTEAGPLKSVEQFVANVVSEEYGRLYKGLIRHSKYLAIQIVYTLWYRIEEFLQPRHLSYVSRKA